MPGDLLMTYYRWWRGKCRNKLKKGEETVQKYIAWKSQREKIESPKGVSAGISVVQ